MRLVTFEAAGLTRLGAEWRGRVIDLQNALALDELRQFGLPAANAAAQRFPSDMLSFLRGGQETQALANQALRFIEFLPPDVYESLDGQSAIVYRPDQVRLRAPITRPGKVICIGLNYRDHAIESGMDIPTEPVLFSKFGNTIIGPEDTILAPTTSDEVDYEAELVVVIGKTGKNIAEDAAMDYVAGYTCGHDVSARDYQLKRGGNQWMVGKTFDTFAPIGPALVTREDVPDPHALGIRCVVNGETLQNSSTAQLIFNVPQAIAYLSHVMTLEPGDIIFTGTPPGVGMARKPPVWLKAGDVVEIQIEGIGTLRNPVRAG